MTILNGRNDSFASAEEPGCRILGPDGNCLCQGQCQYHEDSQNVWGLPCSADNKWNNVNLANLMLNGMMVSISIISW